MTEHKKTEKHAAPKSKAEIEQELQKKYMELQVLKQHINTLVQQKQMVDERTAELRLTMDALKNFDSIKGGQEIWSTLGSGTFIKSDIVDIKSVLVAVGAGVVVSEKVDVALKILESRLGDLDAVSTEVIQQAEAYVERINKLQPEVEALAEQLE